MVAGDLVNTASRVQSAASPGGVLVGEATKRATEAAIEYEDAGDHELRARRSRSSSGGRRGSWPARRGDMRRGSSRRSSAVTTAAADQGDVPRDRRGGRAHMVSVIGPAGIGKWRLGWEFEKYVDGLVEDTRFHVGRCRRTARASATGRWPRWCAAARGSRRRTTRQPPATKLRRRVRSSSPIPRSALDRAAARGPARAAGPARRGAGGAVHGLAHVLRTDGRRGHRASSSGICSGPTRGSSTSSSTS